jgi:hypothetical protein
MMTIKATIHSIHQHLTDTFAAVDSWFDQPEDLRNWRPADGGWTINEILEHISLTNFSLLKLILFPKFARAKAFGANGPQCRAVPTT